MSSRSFATTTTDKAVIADATAYHVRHLAASLRSMRATARVLRVSLRTSRHSTWFLRGGSQEVVLPTPSADTITLLQAAQTTIDQLYETGIPYHKVGVTLTDIQPVGGQTASLFASTPGDDRSDLLAAVDQLNNAADTELVTIGTRLKTPQWRGHAKKRSGRYTTDWSDIATVSATGVPCNLPDICT